MDHAAPGHDCPECQAIDAIILPLLDEFTHDEIARGLRLSTERVQAIVARLNAQALAETVRRYSKMLDSR